MTGSNKDRVTVQKSPFIGQYICPLAWLIHFNFSPTYRMSTFSLSNNVEELKPVILYNTLAS